jgi:two-component system, cell cycle response regulator
MLLGRRSHGGRAHVGLTEMLGERELPSFPGVVMHALERVSANAEIHEVSNAISADPGLTVKLLRLVNSPAVAPRSPVTSVHQAAVMLGRNQLESLLITTGVSQVLPTVSRPGFELKSFWRTAALRASAAATVAAMVDPARQSEHFTGALLQDMAQPFLVDAHSSYSDLVCQWEGRHHDLIGAETDEMGWTHVDAGTAMCQSWNFPPSLTAAVSLHHDHEAPAEVHRIGQWAALIEGDDSDIAIELAHQWFGLDADHATILLGEAKEQATDLATMFA